MYNMPYETKWELDEQALDRKMINMGFRERNSGTAMLREAIKMWQPGMMFSKELYPAISEKFHSTPGAVERAMRAAISAAWERGDTRTANLIFGYGISPDKGCPTVSEFVSRMHRVCNYDW